MAEYEECAVVYVQMWGKPVRDKAGSLVSVRKRLPYVVHRGKEIEFARIPQARAWALENGYAGIRVELT